MEKETSTSESCRQTLIVGLGNILLKDEGIGVRVVESLRDEYLLPDNIRLLDGGCGGLTLLEFMAKVEKLIIVDAARCGAPAGTVYRLGAEDIIRENGDALSGHQTGLRVALSLAGKLQTMPDTVIFGVEPCLIDYGLELSSELKPAVGKVIMAIFSELGLPMDSCHKHISSVHDA